MIAWILVLVAVLAGIEIWARPEIHAHVTKATALLVDEWVAVGLFVAVALLVDALVRRFYWHGYLKRRRGLDTPALIQDIVTILLVAIGLSIGLTYFAGLSVTGIVTASGATAIVLGIALQAVIQDLFSGLAINFEGSYAIGDWLTIYSDQVPDPIYGCVTHISWRSTYLTLADGSRLMVPNHMVTSNPVMNHSRPREPKRLSVEVCLDNRIPTDRAADILLGETFKVVRAQPGLARNPEPTVQVSRMDSDATYYEARFYHLPYEIEPTTARSLVLIALMAAVQKRELATPVTQVEMTKEPNLAFEFGEEESRKFVVRAPLFRDSLEPGHVDLLVSTCRPAELAAGSVLMAQGDAGSSMFIIVEGAATVTIRGDAGQSHEVNILAAGDVAGEMSLMTGAPRNATVTALTRVRAIEITKDAIAMVLQKAPELAERFSAVLAERQQQNLELANRMIQREAVQQDLLARITAFFSRAFG